MVSISSGVKPSKPTVRLVKFANIITYQEIQPRAGALNEEVVGDYQAAIERKEELPRLVVFAVAAGKGKEKLLLAAGFHRHEAYKRAKVEEVECEIHTGTRDDAILYAAGSNRHNGQRMSQEDKRRAIAVVIALRTEWSNHDVAKYVGCDHKTVGAVRNPPKRETGYSNSYTGEIPQCKRQNIPLEQGTLPGCDEEETNGDADDETEEAEQVQDEQSPTHTPTPTPSKESPCDKLLSLTSELRHVFNHIDSEYPVHLVLRVARESNLRIRGRSEDDGNERAIPTLADDLEAFARDLKEAHLKEALTPASNGGER